MRLRLLVLSVGDRQARANCQCGELIDRIAAGAPIRKLLFIELLGHTRLPFAGYRPDHRGRIELATIDAHRAAKAAADFEGRLDDGVVGEARRDRLEIRDFPGRAAAGHSESSSSGQVRGTRCSTLYGTKRSCRSAYCLASWGNSGLIRTGRRPRRRSAASRGVTADG